MTYQRRWENRRVAARSAGDEARESYYGIPVIHKPHWHWLIVWYFFLGGISSASYVIATVAEWLGGRAGRPIVRAGRYLSLATLLPCPILLILDLGRPERFYHMLRVFKFRSPMSVGTWGLTVFGAFCTASALLQAARDGLFGRRRRSRPDASALPARLIGLLGAGPAVFVGGYTGVLLAATAVPLWARNYLLLGPLFLTSAFSTATAALSLILAALGAKHETLGRLERLDSLLLLVEGAILALARANLGPVLARPISEGRLGRLRGLVTATAGIAAPLGLQSRGAFLGARTPRPVAMLASLLVLAGGFTLRYVMVIGGLASADDPQATFELAGREPR